MIVEPTPTSPPSRLRRATGVIGLVTPVLLLVAITAGGVLGQATDRRSPGPLPSPVPTTAGTGRPPADAGNGTAAGDRPDYPTVADNLAVLSIPEALAAAVAGGPGRLFAVAGHLAVPGVPAGCEDPARGPLGPLCERQGILTDAAPPAAVDGSFRYPGAHLHPRFPVGVRLPAEVDRTNHTPSGPAVPVVVVGRFASAAACSQTARGCREAFVVDHVVWADGALFPSEPVIDAGIDGNPPDWMFRHRGLAEFAAIGWSGAIFVSALVRPSTVARIDPEAAAILATLDPPAGLVWYVRGLETGYDPLRYPLGQSLPRLSWAIVDDVTGAILARRSSAPLVP